MPALRIELRTFSLRSRRTTTVLNRRCICDVAADSAVLDNDFSQTSASIAQRSATIVSGFAMRRSMGAGKLRITHLNQRLRRGSRRSFSAPAATPSDLLDQYLGCCTRQLPPDKYRSSLPGWAHPIACRNAAGAGRRRRQVTIVTAAIINAPATQPLQNVCARCASGIG